MTFVNLRHLEALHRVFNTVTNDDKMHRMARADSDLARAHVQEERARRALSARKAAELGGITNTVWSKYEAGGNLTPGVRKGVAQAFGWPTSWPERLPELSPEPTDLQIIVQRLELIERLVRTLVDGQTSGFDAMLALLEDRLRSVGEVPQQHPQAGS